MRKKTDRVVIRENNVPAAGEERFIDLIFLSKVGMDMKLEQWILPVAESSRKI